MLQPACGGGATCGEAGQPVARKPEAWAWGTGVDTRCPGGPGVPVSVSLARFAVCAALPLKTCSWSWKGLWAWQAGPPGTKAVPGWWREQRRLGGGDPGIVSVPLMTQAVACG